ncbi:MAG: glycosyltransferase family 9 protein [Candidatus Omnitrophica bacterium]|nr:glycosyltransferase family 9 protein [Candidatus Omnitrophota bacterium]
MDDRKIKNIFFIRSDRLGEFLLSLYAIKLVKLNYPDSKIYLLAKKDNIELARGIDFVNCFLEYEDCIFGGFKGALNLSGILRREKIDCVISLNPKKEFHLASLLAFVKLRIGYNRKFGFCLNGKIEDEKYKGIKHEVEYNLDLMKLLCGEIYAPKIDLAIDNRDTLKALGIKDLTKKYVVIHPFTSNPSKKIGDDFWVSLINRLKNSCARDIVVIGSKDEMGEAFELAEKLKIENLTGKLSLRNLAAFLKYNCSVFVGLDSGPMHLASMIRVPVAGLFKTSNSKRWGPFNTQSLILENKSEEGLKQKIEDIIKFACSNVLRKI